MTYTFQIWARLRRFHQRFFNAQWQGTMVLGADSKDAKTLCSPNEDFGWPSERLGTHFRSTFQRVSTRPRNPRIPIARFDIQTAFRARMSIFKSGISGSGEYSFWATFIWNYFENTFPNVRSDFQNLRLGSINLFRRFSVAPQRRGWVRTNMCWFSGMLWSFVTTLQDIYKR